ncbi:hemolysin [Bacteroidia bacterium]|nr:hemolysin [Bacteroidia bacterium]
METAFIASNRLKLELDRKRNSALSYILGIFTARPGEYITTILVGNSIALVVYSMNMSLLISHAGQQAGIAFLSGNVVLETIVSTIVVIFLAEYIPKAMVRMRPNAYLNFFAVPIYLFYVALYPLTRFATTFSTMIIKMFGFHVGTISPIRMFEKADLENLLDEVAENEEDINKDNEIKLFQNALDFSELKVRDCMVPRVDVEAVDETSSIEELASRFIETAYARILVYRDTIDNIVGYVNSKSMFEQPRSIGAILKKVYFVAETLPAQKMLSQFIRRKNALAVVIDEFGGTAGIISLEDILEEIFGEIEDEHDHDDLVEKETGPGEWVFSCRLEVEYLNEKYNLGIEESDQYHTLAGYIIKMHEGIPSAGQVLSFDGREITILRRSGSKLDLARVRIASRQGR